MKHLFLSIILTMIVFGQDATASKILDEVLNIMNPEFSQGIMIQTIQTTKGDTRELEYDVYTGFFGDASLMRYRKPSRLKNNAILTTDFSDNIWSYNHRTKRVRKLASHAKKQKFEGSDFTYEDMGTGEVWKTDFLVKLGEKTKLNNVNCLSLVMTAKTKNNSYSKMIIWVREEDSFPVQIDYFNQKSKHEKSLFMEDIRVIDEIPTAFKMTMINYLDQTQTIMAYQEVTYQVKFDKNFFSERNLKKTN